MDDWYFGHQSLNGCNPLLLRQTRLLPPNLSVTSDMLRPFLPEGSSLDEELQVRAASRLQLLLWSRCAADDLDVLCCDRKEPCSCWTTRFWTAFQPT